MSVTQTFFLAHTARAKLSREASRGDHNLRLLVGHANMLDTLMLDLADAERQQERWFNQSSVRRTNNNSSSSSSTSTSTSTSTPAGAKSMHIQWADRVVETPQGDWDSDDVAVLSDSESNSSSDDDDDGSDYDGDDQFFVDVSPPTPASVPTSSPTNHVSDDKEHDEHDEGFKDDLEEDYADLALTRTHSHTQHHLPELLSDDESEDDELPSPPSPPQATFDHFSDSEQADDTVVTCRLFSSRSSDITTHTTTTPSKPPPKPLLPEPDRPDFLEQRFLEPAGSREAPIQAC